jgi:hypothetical protein
MADRLRHQLPAGITSALRWAFVVIGVVSMVFGYIGIRAYLLRGNTDFSHGARDVAYYDLELFLVQSSPLAHGGPYTWPLEIARFSAPCVSVYTVIELAVGASAHRIGRARMQRYRGHAVVCGSSRMAAVLTERLRRERRRVVTIEPGTQDRRRADTVIGDPALPARLREAAVNRAAVVYSCLENSDRNVEVVGTIERIRGTGRRAPTRVHAMVQDLDLCLALKARHWSTAGPDGPYVDFFNPDELAAREVVRADDSLFAHEEPRVAVVGSGAFGRSVLVELGRQWLVRRPRSAAPLQITMIGERAREAVGITAERYGFLDKVCHIQVRFGSPTEFLAERDRLGAPRLHRLYVCQEDESEALGTALDAAAHLPSALDTIVVRLDRMSGMAHAFDPAAGAGALFDRLGGRLRVVDVADVGCDPSVIGLDLAEVLARTSHQRYMLERMAGGVEPGSAAAMTPWETLDEDLRVASRAQAFDMGRKMAVLGCLLVPRSAADRGFSYQPGEIELLARREHHRWMAERGSRGWHYGPRDDAAKQHPDFIDWDELPEAERERDREAVRAIPDMLAEVGLAVLRVGFRGQPRGGARRGHAA